MLNDKTASLPFSNRPFPNLIFGPEHINMMLNKSAKINAQRPSVSRTRTVVVRAANLVETAKAKGKNKRWIREHDRIPSRTFS